MPVKLDHVGMAVRSIDETLLLYRDVLEMKVGEVSSNDIEKLRLVFIKAGKSQIELMEPTEKDTVVGRFLDKRGEGIHHICLAVPDIEEIMNACRQRGVNLVEEKPRISASGIKMGFIHPKSTHGVLIELYERPMKGSQTGKRKADEDNTRLEREDEA